MAFNQEAEIVDNPHLRIPQRAGWAAIRDHFSRLGATSEVGIILPVGCGKSGLISITPFALNAVRVLVIAPGTKIRDQLLNDLRSNS
ncbi:hypothetical protein D9M72_322320 [compost metagenome]